MGSIFLTIWIVITIFTLAFGTTRRQTTNELVLWYKNSDFTRKEQIRGVLSLIVFLGISLSVGYLLLDIFIKYITGPNGI